MLACTKVTYSSTNPGYLLSIIRYNHKKYYSKSQIIRRNNTNAAASNLSSTSNLNKLKFIPNPASSNTTNKTTASSSGSPFKFKFINSNVPQPSTTASHTNKSLKWSSHALPSKEVLQQQEVQSYQEQAKEQEKLKAAKQLIEDARLYSDSTLSTSSKTSSTFVVPKKRKRILRPRKAIITLSSTAIVHLKALLDQPNPQMIRVGTRNRGCSGTTYDLQYISEPGKFDEIVEQDGVKIVIDSKALFSVVGSEMDWVDEKLQSKFVFKNPNSKGTCGCGESFMV